MDKKDKHKIFVWNNSSVTNSVISKLVESRYFDEVYYAGKRIICNSAKAFALENDGFKMIEEMRQKGIKYVFSNSESNDKGFIDICEKYGFLCIGSRKRDVLLESSKIYSKLLMKKYSINTPEWVCVSKKSELKYALKKIELPCFIKADGFASSLSAVKVENEKDFFSTAVKYLSGFYGEDSKKILIEKTVAGEEVSIPLILDGKRIKYWNIVKDYKRKYNDNCGPNTGGMGAFCPYKLNSKQINLLDNLILKLKKLLISERHFYKGFMTINVIFKEENIFLLEINTRLGDSEGQTLLKLLNDDLYKVFDSILNSNIDKYVPDFKSGYAMSLNVVNKTYPEKRFGKKAYITKYSLEKLIKNGIDVFFYKRIKQNNRNYIQGFGRFISLCAYNQDLSALSVLLKNAADSISARNIYYRTDIGQINSFGDN